MRVPFLLLLSTLMLGCSTTAVRLNEAERQAVWQNHLTELDAQRNWSVRGRVALQSKDRGWQAGLRWVKSASEQLIQLTGPFGGGVVTLKQNEEGAVLRDNRGNEYVDRDTERLLQQVTGWQLPVNGLQYWVRGQAIPDRDAEVELDDQGRLKRLRQDRWDIRYTAYTRYARLQLPRRIFISRPMNDGSGQSLEIRLVLNSWQSGP